jgi:hypothetical protein
MHADQGRHTKHRRTEASSDRSFEGIHRGFASALPRMSTSTAETNSVTLDSISTNKVLSEGARMAQTACMSRSREVHADDFRASGRTDP